MPLTTDEIRKRWVDFFVSLEHKYVASDSLVPQNDPSVLFTGAGMNQFKDHFLGRAKLDHPWQRATTHQKCIRAGDIDNVGRTPSHHTFFEMMGNFSFGDYFKKEAIEWAWIFSTDPTRGLGMDKHRISVTIFGGDPKLGIEKDTEAEKWWKTYAPELQNKDGSWRIYEYGEHDNFWPADAPSLGPNGPCGPCSEIYYDTKPEQGAPEPVANSKDPTRYVEFWNLVFTQFNRTERTAGVSPAAAGGTPAVQAVLEPLSQKNIDTGSGLERLSRVVQGKANNYEIDLLFPIVQTVAKLSGKTYGKSFEDDRRMRRITDHTRAAVFCIADGVAPKNEGRNYVVRRLMRRAILDGRELGILHPFMGTVAGKVISQMKVGYPEIEPRAEVIIRLIQEEEQAFSRTINDGSGVLENHLMAEAWSRVIAKPSGEFGKLLSVFHSLVVEKKALNVKLHQNPNGLLEYTMSTGLRAVSNRDAVAPEFNEVWDEWKTKKHKLKDIKEKLIVNGGAAFVLWDTFGFPIELTEEICRELSIDVDRKGFEEALEIAKEKSRAGSGMAKEIFETGPVAELKKRFAGKQTDFKGYDALREEGCQVLAIVQGNELVEVAKADAEAIVLLDKTPFYAESGGQVGDKGFLVAGGKNHNVLDTQKQEGLYLHRVKLSGALKVGETVEGVVDAQHRNPTLKHHSATHLLHWALRRVLGTHVEQRGSLVAPDRLRFDFTHFEQIKPEFLTEIEDRVNMLIHEDKPVETQVLPIAEAKAKGAMALFGEKYGDRVRVVTMGPSVELCGGTHVKTTGQIGYFRVVSEGSVSAGVRRIEALTGMAAINDARRNDELLNKLALTLKTKKETVFERFVALQEEKIALEREIESLRKKAANAAAGELLSNVKEVNGVKLLASVVEGADANALRTTLDGIRKNLKEGAVVLGGAKDGKVALLVSLSPEVVKRGGHAGNLLKDLAPKVGGKGGGKPDMAQGGGSDVAKLPEAIKSAEELLKGMVK